MQQVNNDLGAPMIFAQDNQGQVPMQQLQPVEPAQVVQPVVPVQQMQVPVFVKSGALPAEQGSPKVHLSPPTGLVPATADWKMVGGTKARFVRRISVIDAIFSILLVGWHVTGFWHKLWMEFLGNIFCFIGSSLVGCFCQYNYGAYLCYPIFEVIGVALNIGGAIFWVPFLSNVMDDKEEFVIDDMSTFLLIITIFEFLLVLLRAIAVYLSVGAFNEIRAKYKESGRPYPFC